MKITNPQRLLIITQPKAGVQSFLVGLTGSAPAQQGDDDSVAGLSHTLVLDTAYYQAEVPVWIDEIPEPATWRDEFLKPEAKEVLAVLGAVVFCFARPVDTAQLESVRAALEAIAEVCRRGIGWGWDGVCLAVALPQSQTPHLDKSFEDWEELCRESGFEYVDSEATGRNEYGEPVGMARVKEALEANDWTADAELLSTEDLEDGAEGTADSGFREEAAEMEMEMFGFQSAVRDLDKVREPDEEEDEADEEAQVQELESLMLRLQAVKDQAADMPEAEKKRFAARSVNEIMKSL